MKKYFLPALVLTVASLPSAWADYSYAEDNAANRTPLAGELSGQQVQQELRLAMQSGDLIGLHGAPFNRISPYAYPPKPTMEGKTEMQAQAELARAIRVGDMLALDESGLRLNERFPHVYASALAAEAGVVTAGGLTDAPRQGASDLPQ